LLLDRPPPGGLSVGGSGSAGVRGRGA
jgi:hypothetical protein